MKCTTCFYYREKAYCYKHFKQTTGKCSDYRKRKCKDCKFGKNKDKCILKNKAFPKQGYCKDFQRYERWAFDE